MDRLINLKGEKVALKEMRKHTAWYLKGIRGSGKFRNAINSCEKRQDLVKILDTIVEEIGEKEKLEQEAV